MDTRVSCETTMATEARRDGEPDSKRSDEAMMAMEAVRDGDTALLKRDFPAAVKSYLLAWDLDENLRSKNWCSTNTPIDAINNLILIEGRDIFEKAVCFDLLEAIQDRSYKKPILIKRNAIKPFAAFHVIQLAGHLHFYAGTHSGIDVDVCELNEDHPLIGRAPNLVFEEELHAHYWDGSWPLFALELPKNESRVNTAISG